MVFSACNSRSQLGTNIDRAGYYHLSLQQWLFRGFSSLSLKDVHRRGNDEFGTTLALYLEFRLDRDTSKMLLYAEDWSRTVDYIYQLEFHRTCFDINLGCHGAATQQAEGEHSIGGLISRAMRLWINQRLARIS
jgi:hypothetical protein